MRWRMNADKNNNIEKESQDVKSCTGTQDGPNKQICFRTESVSAKARL